jgi:PAS domain S-box-containing protein
MESREDSGGMTDEIRSSVTPAATSILQLEQRAEQEIRRANDVLEERTRQLAQVVATMRATLESTSDAILVTDEKNEVVDFNDKFLDIWTIPRQVLKGGTLLDVQELASRSFMDPKAFLARVSEIAVGGQESFDLLELRDGRIFERYSKVLSVEGVCIGRVWSLRDVTQHYLSEITSRRLAAIVASSDDAIIGKDVNSIITSWNIGAERIFGYTAEEMIGTSIMRLIPPNRHEEEREILSRIRRGERVDHFETVRLAKDGRELSVSVTVSPIKDSAGHVIGASKVARDITERRNSEKALKRAMEEAEKANHERLQLLDSERDARSRAELASRMKDEFLATLSHELRTPLNAVLGWAHILHTGNLQDDELKQGLDAIERNARTQAQIIEDLLDMSRIISGKMRLDVAQIDLPAVLNESVDTVRTAAEAKGIHLQVVVDPRIGPISGDADRLRQVFWNLLNNTIKFTPKGGQARVLLERVKSHIEVSVNDTGEGIAPEFLPYVFDRFQQGDASTTRRHGGLGLGLAIVKQLVELHGGTVDVRSDGIDKGTTFTVHLPLLAVHFERDKESRQSRTAARKNQRLPEVCLTDVHVLVVDDEGDARELVKRLLEMAGATVSLASCASAAIERILTMRPDVLVCDIGMPMEDGYSLMRRLRILEQSQANALPAVALTAYARSEDRTKAIRAGFQNHLSKPVEPAELLAVVASLAGRRGKIPLRD